MELITNKKIINLRFLAILLVVIGHSIILYDPTWGYYDTIYSVPILVIIKKIINCIQMPLFFSISGFLFYFSLPKIKNIFDFAKKKFLRIIIPFIIVGLLYFIPIRYLIGYYNGNLIKNIINMFIGKDVGHLWFLPTLFLMFICYYYIGKIIEKYNKKVETPILLVLTLASMISSLAPSYFGNLFKYLIYFHLGYEINKLGLYNMKNSKTIISTICCILLLIVYLFLYDTLNKYVINIFMLLIGLTACISLYNIIPEKNNKIINKISTDSFGIYLFHSPLCYISFKYLGNCNPIIVISINLLFAIVAMIITNILRNIKLEFIIGERRK